MDRNIHSWQARTIISGISASSPLPCDLQSYYGTSLPESRTRTPEHLVAGSYHNIGLLCDLLCKSQGKGEEALDQYTKALEINIRVYGQDHPSVANSKYCMGHVYAERNEMDMARELFLECQRIYHKVYGSGHSETVRAANAAQLCSATQASRCAEESV